MNVNLEIVPSLNNSIAVRRVRNANYGNEIRINFCLTLIVTSKPGRKNQCFNVPTVQQDKIKYIYAKVLVGYK